MLKILIADRDAAIVAPLEDALARAGHLVAVASDWSQTLDRARGDGDDEHFGDGYDLLICDVETSGLSTRDMLRALRRAAPRAEVLLVTARPSVREAILAVRERAIDYLPKPLAVGALLDRVAAVVPRRGLPTYYEVTPTPAPVPLAPEGRCLAAIVGRSPVMRELRARIQAIADSDTSVLITGESGTGKELVARAVHEGSRRANAPLVTVNAATLPLPLIEAELFGHERGAFTGADRRREGRFLAANGGTLFLDEIGDLPLEAQVKLLRVLQEGCFEPLGSNKSIRVDVRVVSATHRNLAAMCREGKFREDLLYRLRVFEIETPPLRERMSDLPILVDGFLTKFTRPGEGRRPLSQPAWNALRAYPFPGNVRELENTIQHAATLARGRGEIDLLDLPEEIAEFRPPVDNTPAPSLSQAVEQFEREYILRALAASGGQKKRAAQLLGISRQCLYQKLGDGV
jgi:DNA-binding NtrC family response regulator